jgi:hypothetical protein
MLLVGKFTAIVGAVVSILSVTLVEAVPTLLVTLPVTT